MKERPILFNGEMVRAILDGRKTQTRRVVKHKINGDPRCTNSLSEGNIPISELWVDDLEMFACPYGKVGDRLWVRETFAIVPRTAYAQSENCQQIIKPDCNHDAAIFRAGWERSTGGIRWRPSIHMPRWASRITLEITNVRVERLQDISEQDAKSEGVSDDIFKSHCQNEKALPDSWPVEDLGSDRFIFSMLWQSINGANSWSYNPWVWVIEFKRI